MITKGRENINTQVFRFNTIWISYLLSKSCSFPFLNSTQWSPCSLTLFLSTDNMPCYQWKDNYNNPQGYLLVPDTRNNFLTVSPEIPRKTAFLGVKEKKTTLHHILPITEFLPGSALCSFQNWISLFILHYPCSMYNTQHSIFPWQQAFTRMKYKQQPQLSGCKTSFRFCFLYFMKDCTH